MTITAEDYWDICPKCKADRNKLRKLATSEVFENRSMFWVICENCALCKAQMKLEGRIRE